MFQLLSNILHILNFSFTTPPSKIRDFCHLPLHRGGFGWFFDRLRLLLLLLSPQWNGRGVHRTSAMLRYAEQADGQWPPLRFWNRSIVLLTGVKAPLAIRSARTGRAPYSRNTAGCGPKRATGSAAPTPGTASAAAGCRPSPGPERQYGALFSWGGRC